MKKVLILIQRYELGPYRAIILPCLFPCAAPLGPFLPDTLDAGIKRHG